VGCGLAKLLARLSAAGYVLGSILGRATWGNSSQSYNICISETPPYINAPRSSNVNVLIHPLAPPPKKKTIKYQYKSFFFFKMVKSLRKKFRQGSVTKSCLRKGFLM
jgi:hypothetical protein